MDGLNLGVSFNKPSQSLHNEREMLISKIFGLNPNSNTTQVVENFNLPISEKSLIYITGYSGSGKSSLLNEISKKIPEAKINQIILPESKLVIDCFAAEVAEVIQWLGRFGLGEARVLTTPIQYLSVGQKERLRLAMLLWEKPKTVLLDEFLSSLDRFTARVIAFQFQKIVRKLGITCIVATAHHDLEDALFADVTLKLDLGGRVQVQKKNYTELELKSKKLSESEKISIEAGSLEDYQALKHFHYMDQQVGDQSLVASDIVSIQKAVFEGKVVGVRVFTKIFPSSYEKINIFKLINEKAVLSSRVIVHPAFRGLGLSKLMDFNKNQATSFQIVVSHSALAKYFPFDFSAGYKTYSHPSESRTNEHDIFEKILKEYGLNEIEEINNSDFCKQFWHQLTIEKKLQLKSIATKVVADYDFKYLKSLLTLLNLKISDQTSRLLESFFKLKIEALPLEHSWQLLSEALHFPMLGVVRYLTR